MTVRTWALFARAQDALEERFRHVPFKAGQLRGLKDVMNRWGIQSRLRKMTTARNCAWSILAWNLGCWWWLKGWLVDVGACYVWVNFFGLSVVWVNVCWPSMELCYNNWIQLIYPKNYLIYHRNMKKWGIVRHSMNFHMRRVAGPVSHGSPPRTGPGCFCWSFLTPGTMGCGTWLWQMNMKNS